MDYRTGLLALVLLTGCFGSPTSLNDYSRFFSHKHQTIIYGGKLSIKGSHPYAVAITTGPYVSGYLCGGSLISHRTVLTAAHCIDAVYNNGELDSALRVIVGTNFWATGGTAYTVERNVTHPDHVSTLRTNDIGLLITTDNVEYGLFVQPLCGDAADALYEVDVDTIGGQECMDAVAQAIIELKMDAPPVDPTVHICTLHSRGHGTCNGDSGSALIKRENGHQIGIVSWGFPCALGAPDVFTRVSAYRVFIQTNMVN